LVHFAPLLGREKTEEDHLHRIGERKKKKGGGKKKNCGEKGE